VSYRYMPLMWQHTAAVACIKYTDSCLRKSHHDGFKPKKLKCFGPEISQYKKFNYYLQTFLHKISFLRWTQMHALSMLTNQHLVCMTTLSNAVSDPFCTTRRKKKNKGCMLIICSQNEQHAILAWKTNFKYCKLQITNYTWFMSHTEFSSQIHLQCTRCPLSCCHCVVWINMDSKVLVTLGEVLQSTFPFLHLVHIILETSIAVHVRKNNKYYFWLKLWSQILQSRYKTVC